MENEILMHFADDGLNLNEVLFLAEDLAEPLMVDNDEHERRIVPRNESYYERIIPRYDNILFQEHFRMSRRTFEVLIGLVSDIRPNIHRNATIPLEKKLLFTIWIISKQESFLACGDRFGIARSSAHFMFEQIVSALVELLPRQIVWPHNHEMSVQIFEERSAGFPGVVGAIDGCHIKIKQPMGNANDYYNRNKYHSIILQGVADHKMKFIDIFVGLPGRMHDARVFRNSEIYEKLTNNENRLLLQNQHIIGDSAYPLLINLMTPFKDNGHLGDRQRLYNTKLSSIRSIIERAFARLKGKFRRLKDLDVCSPEMGTNVIAAACVLHNIIIDNDNDGEIYEANGDDIMQEENNEQNVRDQAAAVLKRLEIMNNL